MPKPSPAASPRSRQKKSTAATFSLPLIELRRCSLVLSDQVVLNDVSFAVRPGQRWVLMGPNGAGKTQLLKMLRGDVWPTPTGVESRVYGFAGEAQSTPAGIKQRIAYLGPERQDRYVRYDWNFPLAQVVTTGLFDEDFPLTKPTAAQRARIDRLLRRFGLWRLRHRNMLEVSYGQRRLALIARAFAGNPQVLLLDEAFNGLDDAARRRLRHALEHNIRNSPAWVLTTHRGEELPASITDHASIDAGVLRVEAAPTRPLSSRHSKAQKQLAAWRRKIVARAGAPQRATKPLIVLRDVALFREHRAVLRDLHWTLHQGEHWAICGGNGAGKSTLLMLLYGDLHPAFGGTIERRGMPKGSRIEEWKRCTGFVSPELQADYFLSRSLEEIVISGRYSSIGLNQPMTRGDRALATRWLKFFGLEKLRHRGPREVSYGQLRLALIARAMVNSPRLLLLDEPCTGLDPGLRAHVVELLDQLARAGTQLVMAVHEPQDIPPSVRHVLQILRGGRTQQFTSAIRPRKR